MGKLPEIHLAHHCQIIILHMTCILLYNAATTSATIYYSYGTALMQRPTRSTHFARRTLALDVYHLESSSLQLKNRSILDLQQKLYKAR